MKITCKLLFILVFCKSLVSVFQFEVPFELDNNKLFVNVHINNDDYKLLVDTGSYLTWYIEKGNKETNCLKYKGKKTSFLKKEKESLIIVNYESGFSIIEQEKGKLNLINDIILHFTLGKAKCIDQKIRQKFEGILGLGINQQSNLDNLFTSLSNFVNNEINCFTLNFISKKIIFDKIDFSSKDNLISLEVDTISRFWEIEVTKFEINGYNLCDELVNYYSKCKVIFDTGTQYNTLPSTQILEQFNSKIKCNNNNKLIIEFNNNHQINLGNESIFQYSQSNLLKNKKIMFHSNSIGKIILGLNFILHHKIIFDFKKKLIYFEKENYDLTSNNEKNELSNLISEWKKIIY